MASQFLRDKFGPGLRKLRKQMRKERIDMAKDLQISEDELKMIEAGNKNLSDKEMARIAGHYGYSASEVAERAG